MSPEICLTGNITTPITLLGQKSCLYLFKKNCLYAIIL